jgi:hypothetical protein
LDGHRNNIFAPQEKQIGNRRQVRLRGNSHFNCLFKAAPGLIFARGPSSLILQSLEERMPQFAFCGLRSVFTPADFPSAGLRAQFSLL